MKQHRRAFLVSAAAAASMLGLPRVAFGAERLAESDPQAQSFGYRDDATKVDKAKYPKYAAGESCSTCQLYQGKPGDATGPCPIYGGKLVSAKGWCNAWVKKA